jgi:hypothetical protein
MILLWFRDISIPDGETIQRHLEVIEQHGSVWWGWLKRKEERVPTDTLIEISKSLVESELEIFLYHSDARELYSAELRRISALPGGYRIRSPQVDLTPAYMHESVCPAWFELTRIDAVRQVPTLRLADIPTIPTAAGVGEIMSGGVVLRDDPLRATGATLWAVERAGEDCT